MRNTKALLALLALAATASIAFASVFVYYPVSVSVSPVAPPIVFEEGSNANQPDLGGNTITVTLGANQTSASITVHPTYQTTYYKNITVIKNTDTANAYYITIRVNTALPADYAGSQLIIQTGTGSVAVDLTATGDTVIGQIPAGGSWEIDLSFSIPEGSRLPAAATASIQLIYSNSAETPP